MKNPSNNFSKLLMVFHNHLGLREQPPATIRPRWIPAVAIPAAARGTHGPRAGSSPTMLRAAQAQIIAAVKILRSNLWQNATGATTQAGECEEEESNTNRNKCLDRQGRHREMLYLNTMPVKSSANKLMKQTMRSYLPPAERYHGRNRSCKFR